MRKIGAILCIGISSSWIAVASAQVVPEPGPVPAICIPTSMPDPQTSRTTGSGPFFFQLPHRFGEQPIREIDSMRSAWRTTDGRELITDYGVYTDPFSSRREESGTRLVQCQEAQGAHVPEIVVYQSNEGQYAVGLYWIEPGGRSIPGAGGSTRPTALWMRGLSPREEDLGTLLAILYSVRLR